MSKKYDYYKLNQPPIPEEFANLLREMRKNRDPILNEVLKATHDAGWTLRSIADVLNISHQAVCSRINTAYGGKVNVEIPPVPKKATQDKDKPEIVTLTEKQIEELKEMQAVASTVNGNTPVDHPSRRISEQFSLKLAQYEKRSVRLPYLAKVLGTTSAALRKRLVRHGYKTPAPSEMRELYKNKRTSYI